MRKVRDFDAELKALGDRAKALKARKVEQLGQLVVATGADNLDAELLAGALLDIAASNDASAKEALRAKGASFFRKSGRKASGTDASQRGGGTPSAGDDAARGSGAATGR